MHETEKIERKKNLKKKMSLRNCSNHLLFLKLFIYKTKQNNPFYSVKIGIHNI